MTPNAMALNRFGLGARPDEPPVADPRAWLAGQFARFDPRPAAFADIPTRTQVATQLADYYEQLRGIRLAGGQAARPQARPGRSRAMGGVLRLEGEVPAAPMPENDPLAGLPDQVRRYIRQEARGAYLALAGARMNAALTSPTPFAERLVHFWANHFAISIDKLPVIGLGGLLEVEAIRPHVMGRFSDMLLAAVQHPAMLLYLDQAQSIGPGSFVGTRIAQRQADNPNAPRRNFQRRGGLNENLAREIMELHTLGVTGGYTQDDVTEFARALTGWTVSGIGRGPGAQLLGLNGDPGAFRFAPPVHEPGARTILGRAYRQEGEAQGRAILADLATHPRTIEHVCTKLARHFAGDEPPRALVDRMIAAWRRSDGDLPTVYRALLASPEPWSPTEAKFRTPWDWSVAALRAIGVRQMQPQPVAGLLNQLGQPIWRPGSPAGWDDIAASWAGPDALVRRVEAAERMAGRANAEVDARRLADNVLPGSLGAATALAIARAESPAQGLALLLVSPEFMRR